MPKSKGYGPKHFKSMRAAYDSYQKGRFAETTNPALAPKKKFGKIWGWSKVAKPGK